MITNVLEFQKALEELQSLEVRLARINQDHPLGSKGFTKVGIRKMISRLHDELAIFERSQEACQPTCDNVEN